MALHKLSAVFFAVTLFLSACKLDTKSLLGGAAQEGAAQSGSADPNTAAQPAVDPSATPGNGGVLSPPGKCTHATLRARSKGMEKGCLAPGGPSNWLGKAYFGSGIPGGGVDGPVLRLVFRFLRDGSKPVILDEILSFESKLKLPAYLECKSLPIEFSWQAAVYDCRWKGTPPDQEFLPRLLTVVNSQCGASTDLTLEFDDGPDCSRTMAPFGYPKIFLGHGIVMPPLVLK